MIAVASSIFLMTSVMLALFDMQLSKPFCNSASLHEPVEDGREKPQDH